MNIDNSQLMKDKNFQIIKNALENSYDYWELTDFKTINKIIIPIVIENMEEKLTPGKYYYSIGEVAAMFNVNTSMIRYWEKEFDVLRPRKNKKGNRLFTERDVRYVHVIYQLLKVKGYTLAGAKQALKERFSDYEERIILLETLDKTRSFLLDLDKALAEKQKKA